MAEKEHVGIYNEPDTCLPYITLSADACLAIINCMLSTPADPLGQEAANHIRWCSTYAGRERLGDRDW